MIAMLKHMVLAAALGVGLSVSAYAQDAPKNSEDCLKSSFDLAKSANDKKLADDKLAKVEEMLTKLESACEAQKFDEAAATIKEVKAVIDGK
jgi:hypothetical protein